ncbi:MAG: hypothetical protein WD534_09160 [Phycisphaeraceae bacterium]
MSTTETPIPIHETPRAAAPRVTQWLARNPFYLLSGVCLFAGCFLVSAALREQRDQLGPVLALLGVVTVYEWLVLGLGLLLVARRGLTRDGGYLLLLTTLLLSDGTFVYNELATLSAAVGGTVNAAAVGLGLLKVALIAHVIRVRFDVGQWCVLALNLVAVMALPVVFRALAQAEALTTPALHVIWWIAGVWLAAQVLALGHGVSEPGEPAGLDGMAPLRSLVRRAVLVVPAASVLVHLGAVHFVYEVPFHAAHLTPVLLGLAVYLVVAVRRAERACQVVFLLALAALVLAVTAPGSLVVAELWPGDWTFSPLRLALVTAALLWTGLAWRHRAGWLCLSAVAAIGLAGTGATPGDMADRLHDWGAWSREALGALLPATLLQWGVLILGLAFGLLLLGGVISLRKPAQPASQDEPGDAP